MHNWDFLHLYVDENGVSRVNPNATKELEAMNRTGFVGDFFI